MSALEQPNVDKDTFSGALPRGFGDIVEYLFESGQQLESDERNEIRDSTEEHAREASYALHQTTKS